MVEWMDNVEMAIQKVCASKVYTSAEFKREKDNFHVRKNLYFKFTLGTTIFHSHIYMLSCYIENFFFTVAM